MPTKTLTEAEREAAAAELAERLAEAETKVRGCGNCGDPLEAHGGEEGWVCRGAGGEGCEKGCTEYASPLDADERAELEAHRAAERDLEDEQAARRAEEQAAEQERSRAADEDAVQPADNPPAVDEAVDDEVPGTDLEPVSPASTLPEMSDWEKIRAMATVLAHSNLVPVDLRGKPDDVTTVLLYAHDLGITATQGLSKIHVIKGRPTLAAEMMKALVIRAGHRMWKVEKTTERATVGYQRMQDGRPVGPEQTATFTLEDAETAKLLGKDTWKQYPRRMLWARAVSEACNEEFSDVLAGITYVPEELGYIEAEGVEEAVSGQSGPTPEQAAIDAERADFLAGEEGRKRLGDAIAAMEDDARTAMKVEWKNRMIRPITQLRASEIEAAARLVAEFSGDSSYIEEAEIVPPATAQTTAADDDAEPESAGQTATAIAETAAQAVVEDAADPGPKPFTCQSCARVIRPGNSLSDHAPKCPEAPF